jgi:hypothetical protein
VSDDLELKPPGKRKIPLASTTQKLHWLEATKPHRTYMSRTRPEMEPSDVWGYMRHNGEVPSAYSHPNNLFELSHTGTTLTSRDLYSLTHYSHYSRCLVVRISSHFRRLCYKIFPESPSLILPDLLTYSLWRKIWPVCNNYGHQLVPHSQPHTSKYQREH